jgi:probable rRNA maturation factor
MDNLDITFENTTTTPVDKKVIHRHLLLILQRLKHVGTVKIEIMLVGDKKIQQLNKQFLHHDYPTDVLSFPGSETEGSDLLGSLAISIDTAKKQAAQAGTALIEELKILAGHGLLHLLGYHHK